MSKYTTDLNERTRIDRNNAKYLASHKEICAERQRKYRAIPEVAKRYADNQRARNLNKRIERSRVESIRLGGDIPSRCIMVSMNGV